MGEFLGETSSMHLGFRGAGEAEQQGHCLLVPQISQRTRTFALLQTLSTADSALPVQPRSVEVRRPTFGNNTPTATQTAGLAGTSELCEQCGAGQFHGELQRHKWGGARRRRNQRQDKEDKKEAVKRYEQEEKQDSG